MGEAKRLGNLPLLYNGLVETGVRSLLILDACWPRELTMDELRLLDLFIVFGEDIGFPGSLHALLLGRERAHAFRIKAIRQGLDVLLALGCITIEGTAEAPRIKASSDAFALEGYVSTPYLAKMQEVARWMEFRMEQEGQSAFLSRLEAKLHELALGDTGMPTDTRDRFVNLDAVYASDLIRLEGLAEAAQLLRFLGLRRSNETAEPLLPIAPAFDWLVSLETAAKREIASVRAKRGELAEVMQGMA